MKNSTLTRPAGQHLVRLSTFSTASPPLKSAAYTHLIINLGCRQVRSSETGMVLSPIFKEHERAEFREMGYTDRDLDEQEYRLVNSRINDPSYEVLYDAPLSLHHAWKRDGRESDILEYQIVPVPNRLLNALICRKLETLFSREDLLSVPGFTLVDGDLRLDLDDWLSRRGFIMPFIRDGLIDSLRVFRYPEDRKPFTLRSRPGEVALNG